MEELRDRPWLLRGTVIGLALVVGLVAWLATRDGDGDSAAPQAAEPRIVSEEELEEVAAAAGHPVYWAGPMEGASLEVTEAPGGNVQVRYLDEGAEAGEDPAGFLTIGSYPLPDPTAALEGFAERPEATASRAPDGRKLVVSATAPSSVYFVSPDNSVQVEVYAPSPQRAMRLARSNRVQPVG